MISNLPLNITPNLLLRRLKRRLGKHLKLSYSDEELIEILNEDTLPVYSIFFPNRVEKVYNNLIDRRVPGTQAKYYLHDPSLSGLKILEIEDVEVNNCIDYAGIDPFYASGAGCGGLSSYELVGNVMMEAEFEAMANIPIVFHYEKDNIVNFNDCNMDFGNSGLKIILLTTHALNLSTIKETYYEYLFKLFELDCKIALYNDMKYLDKVDTISQQIDLKIDDWQGAEDQREQLIEKYNSISPFHRTKKLYIV